MSCAGCIYLIGKDATCPQTYACNTSGDRPKEKPAEKKQKSKK